VSAARASSGACTVSPCATGSTRGSALGPGLGGSAALGELSGDSPGGFAVLDSIKSDLQHLR